MFLTDLNGTLYFNADNNGGATIGHKELYAYTGSGTPTQIGGNNITPEFLTPLNGKLYFSADLGTVGTELYVYDPANPGAGIQLAADINTTGVHADSSPSNPVAAGWTRTEGTFAVLNGKLYFNANDGTHGNELYSYDPLTGVASLVADIKPTGSQSSDPSWPPQSAVNSLEARMSCSGDPSALRMRRYRSSVVVEPSAASSLAVELIAAQKITAISRPTRPLGT